MTDVTSDAIWMTALMFGLLIALSIKARLMHKAARDRVSLLIRLTATNGLWYARKCYWAALGFVYDCYNYFRRSRLFSPGLYLPELTGMKLPEFLRAVKKHPGLTETVHERLLRIIRRKGINHRRTFELRFIYGDRSLIAWRAFEGCDLDPRMTSDFVAALGRPTTFRRAISLVGVHATGKTDMVLRICALLEEAEPVPYLKGTKNRANPLQVLHVLRSFTSRYSTLPEDEALFEILEDLGVEQLLDSANQRVRKVCGRYGVPVTLRGISRLRGEALSQVLFEALGISSQTCCSISLPSDFEEHIFKEKLGVMVPADLTVEFFYAVPTGRQFPVQPVNWDRSALVGSEALHRIPFGSDLDPENVDWQGAANDSNRGVLVLTEAMRLSPEAWTDIMDVTSGVIKLPNKQAVCWEGLAVCMDQPEDFREFTDDYRTRGYVGRLVPLACQPCLSIADLEAKLREKLRRKQNLSSRPFDALVVPYLCRLISLSGFHSVHSVDRLDPKRRFTTPQLGRIYCQDRKVLTLQVAYLAVVQCSQEGDKPITVEEVMANLTERLSLFCNVKHAAACDEALRPWLSEPHPVMRAVDTVRQWWNKTRFRLLSTLHDWSRRYENYLWERRYGRPLSERDYPKPFDRRR